jgi:hypothetical protein
MSCTFLEIRRHVQRHVTYATFLHHTLSRFKPVSMPCNYTYGCAIVMLLLYTMMLESVWTQQAPLPLTALWQRFAVSLDIEEGVFF